jgi:hypothetical protein
VSGFRLLGLLAEPRVIGKLTNRRLAFGLIFRPEDDNEPNVKEKGLIHNTASFKDLTNTPTLPYAFKTFVNEYQS